MLLSVPYLRPLQRYSDLQQSSFEHLQHISRQLQSDLDCLVQVTISVHSVGSGCVLLSLLGQLQCCTTIVTLSQCVLYNVVL